MSQADKKPLSQLLDSMGVGWSALTRDQHSRFQAAFGKSGLHEWVLPETIAELAAVVQAGYQQQWRFGICGQASKVSWGCPWDPVDLILSTQRLTAIVEHAAADLTVTVQAGCLLQDLQAHLRQSRQWWPVNPLYPTQATIGGILATGDTGSYRHRYGSVRDLLLGIQFVRHDGELAKAGGRVVKNVAGYDLMKLMTGSYGSLGILTEVTLRLYPLPEAQVLVVGVGEPEAIETWRQRIMSSTLILAGLDLVSPGVLNSLMPGSCPEGHLGLVVDFHGLQESVNVQVETVQDWAGSLAITLVEGGSSESYSARMAEIIGSPASSFLAKVGILSNQCVGMVVELLKKYPTSLFQIHAASGVGRWRVPTPTIAPSDIYAVRSGLKRFEGFLVVLEAPIDFKQRIDIWGYTPSTVELMTRLKQQWDPGMQFNPGKMGLQG